VANTARSVLIVEDDETLRELEARLLCGEGYYVQEVADGRAAIEALERSTPDLVLLDLVMPGTNGWDVLAHVSRQPRRPRVILVTGLKEAVRPRELGPSVAGYLFKPFEVDQLLKICRTVLRDGAVSFAGGNRHENRRGLVIETTLLSETGSTLVKADLIDISPHGFRLEVAIPLRAGDPVRIAFPIPGRPEPLRVTGRIRWRNDDAVGAEVEEIPAEDAVVLRSLIGA
jgi:two-component system, response regulator, stage 0 sporulation protein F